MYKCSLPLFGCCHLRDVEELDPQLNLACGGWHHRAALQIDPSSIRSPPGPGHAPRNPYKKRGQQRLRNTLSSALSLDIHSKDSRRTLSLQRFRWTETRDHSYTEHSLARTPAIILRRSFLSWTFTQGGSGIHTLSSALSLDRNSRSFLYWAF